MTPTNNESYTDRTKEESNVPNFAMQFDQSTRTFSRHEFTEPQLRPGEILVQVTCCTICGSDLHTFTGRRSGPESCVLGHEIIGEIAAWNAQTAPLDFHGNELRVGQRVTWAMAVGCGSCFYCQRQLNQKCESLFKYGHESADENYPTGGLSHHCVIVPGTPIFPINDKLADEVACPANCATATVMAATRLAQQSHPLQGSTVMIMGAGMLGLTAAAQLSEVGAAVIAMADVAPDRLELARDFGATHTICSDVPEKIEEFIRSHSNNRGADVALDFAGPTSTVSTCIQSVRTGGCVVLVGSVYPTDDLSISPESIVRRMLTIRGVHNYLPQDLGNALQFLERTRDRFPFAELVTDSFRLEQTTQAFDYALNERPVRVAIRD